MPLELAFSIVEEGTTVPYAPIFDEIRRNHGFIDLRGRPDLAGQIFEGSFSPALRELLIRIAKERSYFSLGCDLGRHSEEEEPQSRRKVSGGYIQIASMNYSGASTDQHSEFCEAFGDELKRHAHKRHWTVNLQGAYVQFKIPEESPVFAPSLWVWFFAAERSHKKSDESREGLLTAIGNALHVDKVRRCLC